jgi:class 3 adenylate cyclase
LRFDRSFSWVMMPFREFHYRWEFDLKSSPDRLWPLVADTNRFNRDTGVPAVEMDLVAGERLKNARRRLRLSAFGIQVEWEEQPFEWVRPHRFGVVRRYSRGPIAELRVVAELIPAETRASESSDPNADASPSGGTKLIYQVWVQPKNVVGLLVIPLQIGVVAARSFAKAFREYDKLATRDWPDERTLPKIVFASGGRRRLLSLSEKLIANGASSEIVAWLVEHIETADDLALAQIRPYELADNWKARRRMVLETCLWATRVGLLDLQWQLLCPMCRGGASVGSLSDLSSRVHCPGCNIDFTLNFEQAVELTFRPNPAIRRVEVDTFCIGGPQQTPHVVAQQLLAAGAKRAIDVTLGAGRYRLRTMGLAGAQHLQVIEGGAPSMNLRATEEPWPVNEINVAAAVTLELENATNVEQLFILERTAWSDQSATAAEVTALQVFRDLFASEALRSGEQISVGTLTVLFTDLKNSTKFYQEVGDAAAFGSVMNHFDVLRTVIADEDGAVVKTIGDAVMAVFRHPAAALRAMLHAQQQVASPQNGGPALTLKAGLHVGRCIAVTLNDRLDYFGSTVNFAARLEGQSTGGDVIISAAVYADPEVQELLEGPGAGLTATRFEIPLKGFEHDRAELWRVARGSEYQL